MSIEERSRLEALCHYENLARKSGYRQIVGVDEAGRGPLAGPVVAAACLIPEGVWIEGVDDSKKLTAPEREKIYTQLTTHSEIAYGVGIVEPAIIDKINILQATIQAMLQAIATLKVVVDLLLVDGLKLPHPTLPVQKIIGGDALSYSIAAASIIAKVSRDRLMVEYHQQWPQYGFAKHKGYGTAEHIAAIGQWGPSPIQRLSFKINK